MDSENKWKENWDWKKMIPSWEWHKISFNYYPEWELVDKNPSFVKLAIKKGTDRSSRDIAIEWDDISEGLFYYRDWTEDTFPIVHDKEIYWSGFWFQYKEDALFFCKLYDVKLSN